MKHILFAVSILLITAACTPQSQWQTKAPETSQQAGQIIEGTSEEAINDYLEENPEAKARLINKSQGIYELFTDEDEEALKEVFVDSEIEQNYVFKALDHEVRRTPPRTIEDWVDRHFNIIHARQAQEATPKGEGITIAVLDTGISFFHPEILPNLAINQNEDSQNGIDDDGNGFTDDIVGWNFIGGNNAAFDGNSHGTYAAGLIAGTVTGVATKAKILPVKVLSDAGSGDVASIAGGIIYAVDNGADIINMSLGGSQRLPRSWARALLYAESKGVLIVAAAGNSAASCARAPSVPASVPLPNIMSVAATLIDSLSPGLANYSNFGDCVHIAAPAGPLGGGLASTHFLHEERLYGLMNGTSAAAPVVSGVAALVMSQFPNMSAIEVKQKILDTGRVIESHQGLTQTGKIVDALEAVR